MRTLTKRGSVKRLVSLLFQTSVGAAVILAATAPAAIGTPVNTNSNAVYDIFATNATVQNFENLSGKTPLSGINTNYANALNSSLNVPLSAQLSLDITGLLFHSGGGSLNNPTGNPGTPTALLTVPTATDARSPSTVVGSLEINTTNLDIDNFVEIVFISTLQNRVGVSLNPSLGNVTFTAFDSSGGSLESFTGNAGNFVGVQRPSADIKFVSIVGRPGWVLDR